MPTTLGTRDISSPQPKVQMTPKTWDPNIGPMVIKGEVQEV
jgi:hypothetical protein